MYIRIPSDTGSLVADIVDLLVIYLAISSRVSMTRGHFPEPPCGRFPNLDLEYTECPHISLISQDEFLGNAPVLANFKQRLG